MLISFHFSGAPRVWVGSHLLILLLLLALSGAQAAPLVGTDTKLPLPRFATFRANEVNLRVGPGLRYPTDWVYHRAGLPVQIWREFHSWRLIQTDDGTKGWVHVSVMTARRSMLVIGKLRVLRSAPDEGTPAVARLKPDVIGWLLACMPDSPWCRVNVKSYDGWLQRAEFWGVFSGETVTG